MLEVKLHPGSSASTRTHSLYANMCLATGGGRALSQGLTLEETNECSTNISHNYHYREVGLLYVITLSSQTPKLILLEFSLLLLFQDRVHCAALAGLELIGIYLSLPPKCWA